jgi:hypothetical protein
MCQAVAKTHLPEPITDEPEERLLYDPKAPAHAVLVDGLSGGVSIDNHGELFALRPVRAVLCLIPVTLVVAVHSVIAYFMWFR